MSLNRAILRSASLFRQPIRTMSYSPKEHGGLKQDGTPDKRMNSQHGLGADPSRASELGKEGGKSGNQPDEIYKPKEHGGMKEDGTPDKRLSSEHGLGGDRERASELGKQGGKSSNSGNQPDHIYKPKEHGGLKEDGTPDKRVSSEHGLGGDRERASELGKQGGKASH